MFAGVWVVGLIWLCVGCGFPGVSVWVCCLRLGFAFLVIASVCLFWADFVACVCWFRRCGCGCGLSWYSVSCLRIFGLLLVYCCLGCGLFVGC